MVAAQVDPKLTGTWSTKSNKVFTGPVRSSSAENVVFVATIDMESRLTCDDRVSTTRLTKR